MRFPFAVGLALVLCIAAPSASHAKLISLTFDELPQPTDIAPSVEVGNIRFTYEAGAFAVYNSFNTFTQGIDALNLDGAVLEADTLGTLTIDFLARVDTIEFAIAFATQDPLAPALSIELFDTSLGSLGSTAVNASVQVPGTGFSEGLYSYVGGPSIRRVVLSFDADVAASVPVFAIDNLKVQMVPEPNGLALAGLGILIITGGLVRRRFTGRMLNLAR